MEELPVEVVNNLMSYLSDNAVSTLSLLSTRIESATSEVKANDIYWLEKIARLYGIFSIDIVKNRLRKPDSDEYYNTESTYRALDKYKQTTGTRRFSVLVNNPGALSIEMAYGAMLDEDIRAVITQAVSENLPLSVEIILKSRKFTRMAQKVHQLRVDLLHMAVYGSRVMDLLKNDPTLNSSR